jgi:hypothetical protein
MFVLDLLRFGTDVDIFSLMLEDANENAVQRLSELFHESWSKLSSKDATRLSTIRLMWERKVASRIQELARAS